SDIPKFQASLKLSIFHSRGNDHVSPNMEAVSLNELKTIQKRGYAMIMKYEIKNSNVNINKNLEIIFSIRPLSPFILICFIKLLLICIKCPHLNKSYKHS